MEYKKQMKKNFYQVGEKVYLPNLKRKGIVRELDKKNVRALVSYYSDENQLVREYIPFAEIEKSKDAQGSNKDTIMFAKVRLDAIVPSKRFEDAGYDFYANFEQEEMVLPKGKATMIPTGIATAFSPKYYLNMKHERGSTGKHGMAILSGVVDSGYRGEIFVAITPTDKDIIISKRHTEVQYMSNCIIYPYSKAIAQGTLEFVPDVRVKEISYEQLKAIPSQRGIGKIGSSGK